MTLTDFNKPWQGNEYDNLTQHRIYSNITAKSLQYCTKVAITLLQHCKDFAAILLQISVLHREIVIISTTLQIFEYNILINTKGNAVQMHQF